uniref:Uncharacterized protein n=1 Tax=Daucus carota subsp. sativus TaxID=79200 RepID=A0A166GH69_DAUCS
MKVIPDAAIVSMIQLIYEYVDPHKKKERNINTELIYDKNYSSHLDAYFRIVYLLRFS